MLAVIHIDLDGSQHIFRAHGWPHDEKNDTLFTSGMRHALDFLDVARIKATMFVIADDLDHPGKRELIVEALRRGHEIASHTLSHRRLPTLSSVEKRDEIFGSRQRLTNELGADVLGFRAPGFALDRESLELIDAAGYQYDSSLFADRRTARRIGIAGVNPQPSCPLPGRALVELALPAHAPLPVPFHPCYSLVLGRWYFACGLRLFRRTVAPLVLLFHLTDFADPLPSDRLPGWKARLFTLSHLSARQKFERCARMLDLVRRNYAFVSTREILEQCDPPPRQSVAHVVVP